MSELIIYPITLDMRRNLHQVIVMKENDANSRIIQAKITDNGKLYTLPPKDTSSDNYIAVKWSKPDGHVIYDIAYSLVDDNTTIEVVCTDQMLCVAGVAEVEFVIYRENLIISTMKFNVSVDASVVSNHMIESSNEFGLLNDLVTKNKGLRDELVNLENDIKDAEEKRVVAEANRVSAEKSRVTAEISRVNAEKSRVTDESERVTAENTRRANEEARQNAETVRKSNENTRIDAESTRISNENTRINEEKTRNTNESTRKFNESTRQANETSRTNAEANREEAFNNLMDEANSEVDRLRQENDTASASAELAKEYSESAKESADKSANSANSASDSANNAKTSETNASTSEQNALASAKSAEEDATTAATKATEASNSANTASTKASEASTSATNAEKSANTASAKATEASNSATASANSAKEADTSASNAKLSETAASTSEDNAEYYYNQAKLISESFSGALRPMGTVTFENLPDVSNASEGDMYNISNQFTTTTIFKEGSGNIIPAGSNVYKTSDGFWDVLAGSPVTGIKGNAENTYRKGNVNITPANLGIMVVNNTADSEKNVAAAQKASMDSNGNTLSTELVSNTEPTSQKTGDFWLLAY